MGTLDLETPHTHLMSQAKVVCQACSTEFAIASPAASASAILNDDDFSSFVAHHPRTPCPGCGLLHTTVLTGISGQWGIVAARNQDPTRGEAREKPLIEVVSGNGNGSRGSGGGGGRGGGAGLSAGWKSPLRGGKP